MESSIRRPASEPCSMPIWRFVLERLFWIVITASLIRYRFIWCYRITLWLLLVFEISGFYVYIWVHWFDTQTKIYLCSNVSVQMNLCVTIRARNRLARHCLKNLTRERQSMPYSYRYDLDVSHYFTVKHLFYVSYNTSSVNSEPASLCFKYCTASQWHHISTLRVLHCRFYVTRDDGVWSSGLDHSELRSVLNVIWKFSPCVK